MSLELRPASAADAGELLRWRNDPATRAASFNAAEVSPEEHAAWLDGRLGDPRCRLLVAQLDGVAIGQVRLDQLDGARAEIHIGLAPEARGQGHAARLLVAASREYAPALAADCVIANVQPDNAASLHAFLQAGFRERERSATAVRLELELADASNGGQPAT
jgi:RimJ/RimL family protein N-acetyltransferase